MKKENALKIFQEQTVRAHWDEKQEKWYFSVQDVVQILTDSRDVKQYIKRLRSRDNELNSNWGTICTPVEMIAAGGKKVVTSKNAQSIVDNSNIKEIEA